MGDTDGDPRIYMAAERTFLAWIRTGIALMALGFVVARFGISFPDAVGPTAPLVLVRRSGASLLIGLALVGTGVLTCVLSAVRHTRYVKAIDEGRFRQAFGSALAFGIVALLAIAGAGMAVWLVRG